MSCSWKLFSGERAKDIFLVPLREVHLLLEEDWISLDGQNRVLRRFFAAGTSELAVGRGITQKKFSSRVQRSMELFKPYPI